MKKKAQIFALIGVVFISGFIFVYANDEKNFKEQGATVVHEDPSLCKEFDITNKALEEYLNGMEDPVKKELLEKFFYWSSDLIPEDFEISSSDPVKQAEIMSKMTTEDLESLIAKMEAELPELKQELKQKYDDRFKE